MEDGKGLVQKRIEKEEEEKHSLSIEITSFARRHCYTSIERVCPRESTKSHSLNYNFAIARSAQARLSVFCSFLYSPLSSSKCKRSFLRSPSTEAMKLSPKCWQRKDRVNLGSASFDSPGNCSKFHRRLCLSLARCSHPARSRLGDDCFSIKAQDFQHCSISLSQPDSYT